MNVNILKLILQVDLEIDEVESWENVEFTHTNGLVLIKVLR